MRPGSISPERVAITSPSQRVKTPLKCLVAIRYRSPQSNNPPRVASKLFSHFAKSPVEAPASFATWIYAQPMKAISAQSMLFSKLMRNSISLAQFPAEPVKNAVSNTATWTISFNTSRVARYSTQRNGIVKWRQQRQSLDLLLDFLVDQA